MRSSHARDGGYGRSSLGADGSPQENNAFDSPCLEFPKRLQISQQQKGPPQQESLQSVGWLEQNEQEETLRFRAKLRKLSIIAQNFQTQFEDISGTLCYRRGEHGWFNNRAVSPRIFKLAHLDHLDRMLLTVHREEPHPSWGFCLSRIGSCAVYSRNLVTVESWAGSGAEDRDCIKSAQSANWVLK